MIDATTDCSVDTQSRPHECRHCGQRFQRTDVLYRHMSKYCPNAQSQAGAGHPRRSRIRVACLQCRDKKLKCNGKSPCSTCVDKGYDCLYQKPDAGDASQESSGLAPGQSEIHAAQPSRDIPGGLSTPISSRDVQTGNVAPDAGSYDSVPGQLPLPQSNEGLADPASWNFDWMMDMEMNDFSVREFVCLTLVRC